eukprot:tig00020909_g15370.t1
MDVFARLGLLGSEPTPLAVVEDGGTDPDFASTPGAGTLDLPVSNGDVPRLLVELYDYEQVKAHDLIGGCKVHLDDLLWPPERGGVAPARGEPRALLLPLQSDKKEAAGELEAELTFRPMEAVDPAEVRDPMAEEERAFSAQVDALVESYKALGPGAPPEPPFELASPRPAGAEGAVPLYALGGPLRATVLDLDPATYERREHTSKCRGHFVRAFLLHGRRELGRAEDEEMIALPFAFRVPRRADDAPAWAAAAEDGPEARAGPASEFMAEAGEASYECSRLPREAQLLVCVFCRREHDEGTDGPVKDDSTRFQARVASRDRRGEPATLVAWTSLQVFDAAGALRTGAFRLPLWRQRPTVPSVFNGKCENCREIDACLQCSDCRSKSVRQLCEDCSALEHRDEKTRRHRVSRIPGAPEKRRSTTPAPGLDGYSARGSGQGAASAAPSGRQTEWGSLLLRVEQPLTAAGSPAPSVIFAYDPQLTAPEGAASGPGTPQRSGANTPHRGSLDASASAPAAADAAGTGTAPRKRSLDLSMLAQSRGALASPGPSPGPARSQRPPPRDPSPEPPPPYSGIDVTPEPPPPAYSGIDLRPEPPPPAYSGLDLRPEQRSGPASPQLRPRGGSPLEGLGAALRSSVGAVERLGRTTTAAVSKGVKGIAGFLNRSRSPQRTLSDRLRDFIEKGNDPYWEVDEESREAIRANADLFTPHSVAFAKFVECLDFSRPRECAFVDQVVRAWVPITPHDALQLLDQAFPDLRIRRYAAERIGRLADEELADYMLQLVQAPPPHLCVFASFSLTSSASVQGMRHASYLDGALWRLLAWRALRGPRVVGLALLWALHIVQKQAEGRFPRTFSLPTDPFFEITGVDMSEGSCRVYSSGKVPYELAFLGRRLKPQPPPSAADGAPASEAPPPRASPVPGQQEGRLRAIFKAGQDLRTDELCLDMISIMDKLWKAAGLDLLMTPYKCVSTARHAGVIEVVEGAYTIGNIMKGAGGVMTAFSETVIADWLYAQKETPFEVAQTNFARSCAGYCVATYVLGLCDRHSDNVMLFPDGRFFHIDFGRFLGHVTKMGGFIPKETAPFLFTREYAYVMEDKRGVPVYEEFVRLCGDAFAVLRRHRNLILHLCMLLHGRKAVRHMYDRFVPQLERDEEVRAHFVEKINESSGNWLAQFYNMCHLVKLGKAS